jgi:hypothetical protein
VWPPLKHIVTRKVLKSHDSGTKARGELVGYGGVVSFRRPGGVGRYDR